jgi:hypothetical protein
VASLLHVELKVFGCSPRVTVCIEDLRMGIPTKTPRIKAKKLPTTSILTKPVAPYVANEHSDLITLTAEYHVLSKEQPTRAHSQGLCELPIVN